MLLYLHDVQQHVGLERLLPAWVVLLPLKALLDQLDVEAEDLQPVRLQLQDPDGRDDALKQPGTKKMITRPNLF